MAKLLELKNTKKCSRCSYEKELSYFGKDKYTKDGHTAACKTCRKMDADNYRKYNKDKINERYKNDRENLLKKSIAYNKTLKGKYRRLKTTQKLKHKEDNVISYLEYMKLVSSNKCHYCENRLPKQGAGIDRIDSSKGYVSGNCLPCCTSCNHMKNDMDYYEFLEHVEKVYIKSVFGKEECRE